MIINAHRTICDSVRGRAHWSAEHCSAAPRTHLRAQRTARPAGVCICLLILCLSLNLSGFASDKPLAGREIFRQQCVKCHGRSGEGRLTYDVYYGWQSVPRKLPILNLNQYAQYYNSLVPEIRAAGGGLDTIGEFKNHPALKLFDQRFKHHLLDRFLYQLGFDETLRRLLMNARK